MLGNKLVWFDLIWNGANRVHVSLTVWKWELKENQDYFRKMAKIVNFLKHESRGSYQFMESRTAPRCHNEEVTLRVWRQTFPGLAWKHPWSQPHQVIVVSDEASAKPRTSNVDGGLEKDYTQSLEQDHPSLPPVTLRKHAKANAGCGWCSWRAQEVLSVFLMSLFYLLVNKMGLS